MRFVAEWTTRFAKVAPACAVLLLTAACHKKAVIAVPIAVPPPPATAPATRSARAPETKPVQATPEPEQAAPAPVQAAPVQVRPSQAAPPASPAKPSPFPPAPYSPPPPIAPTPTPSLGQILTADQRSRLNAAYQSDLRQANAVLKSLNGRALTPEQTDSVSRARAFIRQAGQYHDRDLTTAAELARRARVLTQDLAGAH